MKRVAVGSWLLASVLGGALLLACAGGGGMLSDEQVSLRREGLLELTTPSPTIYTQVEPGESKKIRRAAFGTPPMIPHSIADAEITGAANDCLDCHEESDKDTPGVPSSHRIKAVYSLQPRGKAVHGSLTVFDGLVQTSPVTGQRYNCMLCHALQATNASALVDIGLPFVEPADSGLDKLDGLKESDSPY